MMNKSEVITKLKEFQNEAIKKTYLKHGAKEPFYGVKIEDLKKIQKQVKKDYNLSLELYDTGISDAMYLAALISEPKKMSKTEIHHWAEKAYWYMLSEYPVAWVASESNFGFELALEWIDSNKESIQSSGWATLSSLVAITDNEKIDINLIKKLLSRVQSNIHSSPNRTRHTMNGFVIAVGSFMPTLTKDALEIANKVGIVEVDMGGTACKVPYAPDYIKKVDKMGKLGKKRKTSFC